MKNDEEHLFDNPKNLKCILYILYGYCVFLFTLDFVIPRREYEGDSRKVGWSMYD